MFNGGSSSSHYIVLLLLLYLETNSTTSFCNLRIARFELAQSSSLGDYKDDFWLGLTSLLRQNYTFLFRSKSIGSLHTDQGKASLTLFGDYALRNLLVRLVFSDLVIYLFSRMHGFVQYTLDFGIRILKIEPLHHYISGVYTVLSFGWKFSTNELGLFFFFFMLNRIVFFFKTEKSVVFGSNQSLKIWRRMKLLRLYLSCYCFLRMCINVYY